MVDRRVRILMVKFGDGYEGAIMKLARAFSEAGFEVIYTELQDPQAIVSSAIQESVDHIGVTTLPGTDIQSFSTLIGLLRKEGAGHVHITAGGFLDEESISKIKAMGVVEFFPKGTTYEELIDWATRNIKVTEE